MHLKHLAYTVIILFALTATNAWSRDIHPDQNFDMDDNDILDADDIEAVSFTIDPNTLATTEWSYLDGLDQSPFTTSSVTFATIDVTRNATFATTDVTGNLTVNGFIYGVDNDIYIGLSADGVLSASADVTINVSASATTNIGHTSATTNVGKPGSGIFVLDKLAFTQTDGNEYIDSLNDGYMDYGATTGHRFASGSVVVGGTTPDSLFEVDGAQGLAIQTVTGNTTLDNTHSTMLVNASGNVTITLPTSASSYNNTDGIGRIYNIKKIDADADTVTLDGNASETIDGGTTAVITTQFESITIQADGSNWHIL